MGDQNKGFEKPGGVSEMPLGGARIGHALEAEVFGFKRLNQHFAGAAHVHQPAEQRAGVHGRLLLGSVTLVRSGWRCFLISPLNISPFRQCRCDRHAAG